MLANYKWGGTDDESEEEQEEEANLCLMTNHDSESDSEEPEVTLDQIKASMSRLSKESLLKVLENLTNDHMLMCKEREEFDAIIDKLTVELNSIKSMYDELNVKNNNLQNEHDESKLKI